MVPAVTVLTVPTKSSMVSRVPEACAVRGRGTTVTTLALVMSMVIEFAVLVMALAKLNSRPRPIFWLAERVSGVVKVMEIWVAPPERLQTVVGAHPLNVEVELFAKRAKGEPIKTFMAV